MKWVWRFVGAACAAVACHSESGASARVELQLSNRPAAGATGISLKRDDGFTVLVHQLHVTVSSVELVHCPNAQATRWPSLLPSAYAHGAAAAGKLNVPNVIALVGSKDLVAMGELFPARGTYCSAIVEFSPADDDASGLPADGTMVGLSARADIDTRSERSQPSSTFTLRQSYTFAPLSFGDSSEATIRLSVDATALLKEAINSDLKAETADAWLKSFARALTVGHTP